MSYTHSGISLPLRLGGKYLFSMLASKSVSFYLLQGKSENSSAPVKALRSLPESTPRDRDRLVPLVAETLEEGGSVLVFCGGRGQTQTGATLILDHLEEFAITKTEEAVQSRREALVQEMRDALGQGSSPLLEKLILRGE